MLDSITWIVFQPCLQNFLQGMCVHHARIDLFHEFVQICSKICIRWFIQNLNRCLGVINGQQKVQRGGNPILKWTLLCTITTKKTFKFFVDWNLSRICTVDVFFEIGTRSPSNSIENPCCFASCSARHRDGFNTKIDPSMQTISTRFSSSAPFLLFGAKAEKIKFVNDDNGECCLHSEIVVNKLRLTGGSSFLFVAFEFTSFFTFIDSCCDCDTQSGTLKILYSH